MSSHNASTFCGTAMVPHCRLSCILLSTADSNWDPSGSLWYVEQTMEIQEHILAWKKWLHNNYIFNIYMSVFYTVTPGMAFWRLWPLHVWKRRNPHMKWECPQSRTSTINVVGRPVTRKQWQTNMSPQQ
jgi:hypothetical protein